ncbi:WD and tetratricopeptide repeats containing protein [Ataeniobius toweri]|uniref:WD and tetratricopeptide repeats containing protein n=1 Tax=Ataeniobius toweri TaxID=208326 RepID=A0ABU7B9U5_9TELE|nr:WD and tetratricopeptide repeats containing protein [Ataeniobius toweri]
MCTTNLLKRFDEKGLHRFSNKGQYIVSGSDDGSFFIWEKETTNLVRILQGDESIVNCLQPHPSYCFLATSGIDPVVRLWNPRPETDGDNGRVVEDMEGAAQANQRRMNADPLEDWRRPILGEEFKEGCNNTLLMLSKYQQHPLCSGGNSF